MPQNPTGSMESNFIAGLKTEFTGLNFPENAVTDTDNTVYSLIGDVYRRGGIDYESGFQLNRIAVDSAAKSTFKWENVGGDGLTQMVVQQIGSTLYFYKSSAATSVSPLSSTRLTSTINISTFLVSGSAADPSQSECQYASGNGYLFVYNPKCEPFFVSYNSGTNLVSATQINVQIRDTVGIPESIPFNYRPTTLSPEHQYNLQNQGWGFAWATTSTSTFTVGTGDFPFVVASSTLPVAVGDVMQATGVTGGFIIGTVASYVGNVMTITETSNNQAGIAFNSWNITPVPNYINIFFTTAKGGATNGGTPALLNKYPSNAEQWWQYRSTNITAAAPDGTFSPKNTTDYVVLNNNQAPQGSIILSAFNQTRSVASGIPGLTDVPTMVRPKSGAWFQGRAWYTGVDANFQASGDMPFYTWTENIYFSQINLTNNKFGYCYQEDDPSSPDLFDILPTDGGVITIQGAGSIFKLFPVQNGMLVHAANGIWFITGGKSIGFSADDYTITKISGVRCNSSTSFIDVLGYPMFWNEEGIYVVEPQQQGNGLQVNNLVIGTIATYYSEIPIQSKLFARGTYDPLNYIVQWMFRSTVETNETTRYQYDKVLVYNTANKAFYIYTVSGNTHIHDCIYVSSPGGTLSPDPIIKYVVSAGGSITFAEENDFVTYTDFASGIPVNYISYFVTGYKLHGKGLTRFQAPYIILYSDIPVYQYKMQSVWNYAISRNSGKFTQTQIVSGDDSNYSRLYNRLRIRGRGNVLQFKVTSIDGQPFTIMGWTMSELVNQGM